jgi:antitoxin ParD1/3/4
MTNKPSTASMNISLSETLKDFVNECVAEGIYSNSSDYIRALIRSDMKRRAQQRLETAILEGIASGPAVPMTDEDWQHIRAEGARRAGLAPHENV